MAGGCRVHDAEVFQGAAGGNGDHFIFVIMDLDPGERAAGGHPKGIIIRVPAHSVFESELMKMAPELDPGRATAFKLAVYHFVVGAIDL